MANETVQLEPYWHRGWSRRVTEPATTPYGFYDNTHQIVVVADPSIPPEVPVDHEYAHFNLVRHSTLGLFDQVLTCLNMNTGGDSVGQAAVASLLGTVRKAGEAVHEAVAWFSTETFTEGRENLRVPPAYFAGVRQLRRLFKRMPRSPDPHKARPAMIDIAEAIGSLALNLPSVLDFWRDPGPESLKAFVAGLGRGDNDPDSRFVAICDRLEDVPFDAVHSWAWHVFAAGTPEMKEPPGATRLSLLRRLSGAKNTGPLSVVTRANFTTSQTHHVMKALVESFTADRARPFLRDEQVELAWQFYDVRMISVEIDPYAQVCIVPKPWTLHIGVPTFPTSEHVNLDLLSMMPFLVASVAEIQPYFLTKPILGPLSHIAIVAPLVRSWVTDPLRIEQRWIAPIEEARTFLQDFARSRPIIVGHPGYAFDKGDFSGATLLGSIRHLVMCVTDFSTLWLRLAFLEGSLASTRELEYMLAPSGTSGRATDTWL
jgi:hypothetical protein